MGLIGLVFELIVNRIKKDPQIVDCKKRAKEILRSYLDNKASQISANLTLMQCLEIAAKEMSYNSWYELRQSIKNKELKKRKYNRKRYSIHCEIWFESRSRLFLFSRV